jgi:hypothetical protein
MSAAMSDGRQRITRRDIRTGGGMRPSFIHT